MHRQTIALFSAFALCCAVSGSAIAAEPTFGVRSVRLGATDVQKTAAFYQAVLGLREVQRVERPGLFEIIMNTGATVEQARANTAPKLVIINQPAGTPVDRVSHLILRCTEIEELVRRAAAAGGSVERQPTKSATTGSLIAFIVDPSGNRVELIQEASR